MYATELLKTKQNLKNVDYKRICEPNPPPRIFQGHCAH